MVGLIQKILFSLILEHGGKAALEKVKELVGLDPDFDYQINNNYSDVEWQELFKAACTVLNVSEKQALELYSKHFLSDALERFPVWFDMSKNSYEFLCRQPVIHNNFASGIKDKLQRKAINDKFSITKVNDEKIITYYKSQNKICYLYKCLAKNVIDHYSDQAIITETECMHDNYEQCEIHIEWKNLNESRC